MNPADTPNGGPARHLPGGDSGTPYLTIRSPGDLIAAIPYLLGFHPELSLVVVGANGPSGTCVVRTDLPGQADDKTAFEEMTTRLMGFISHNDFATAFLVGYGPEELATPAIYTIGDALLGHGVSVQEALRVESGRFWSYLCDDPDCCPSEGTPYDSASTVTAAQATFGGNVALADRAELVASVAPLIDGDRLAMRRATQRAERRLRDWVARGGDPIALRARLRASATKLIDELTGHARAGAAPAPDSKIAWLGVLLTDIRIRDEAWVRTDTGDIPFWRDVVRRIEPGYAAAPASLLAYAAYIAGDGGLANVALDRAVDADPNYSMAALLREVITAGVPPAKARLRMTAEELAAAYASSQEWHQAGEDPQVT